jgi:hypothetical protein
VVAASYAISVAIEEVVMPISRRAFALTVLALVLAGGLAAGVWSVAPVPKPVGPLTGAEIMALVSGNTVKGPKFSEYYAPDGSIHGREIEDEDEEYEGTWRVDGDRLCVAFASHDYKSCVSISREQGDAYDFAGAERHSTRTVIAGNPSNL